MYLLQHIYPKFSIVATFPSFRWNNTGVTLAGSAVGSQGVAASLMNLTYSLTMDSSNALYVTDHFNNRIQKWSSGASSGVTVAGQSNGAYGASSTALLQPVGIVLDSNNNMYFTDRGNHRVMYWANGASSGTAIAGITSKPINLIASVVSQTSQISSRSRFCW